MELDQCARAHCVFVFDPRWSLSGVRQHFNYSHALGREKQDFLVLEMLGA